MLKKTVKVGEKEVTFKSSAAIPRMYRIKFKRDIFKDLSKLEQSYKDKDDGTKELEIEDLEIFENVAYGGLPRKEYVPVLHWYGDYRIGGCR